ncbi:hypothetical protein LBMAG56_15540 [Verrucomicrobiota bacterium]|nr:hypothetical protein LBMAG56_15540 [Verrucomicrobiota bacterium]
MRLGKLIIGVAGPGLAALLCAPLAVVLWVTFVKAAGPTDFIFSFDSGHSLSGWQMWVVLTMLASFGIGIFIFSIYALAAKRDDT